MIYCRDLAAALRPRKRWGEVAGRIWFYRAKGSLYLEAVRQWILPVMGATAATKYFGLPLKLSFAARVAFALLAEVAALILGWLERRSGATAANYEVAKLTDPYKVESLALMREQVDVLRRLLLHNLERATVRLVPLGARGPRPPDGADTQDKSPGSRRRR